MLVVGMVQSSMAMQITVYQWPVLLRGQIEPMTEWSVLDAGT